MPDTPSFLERARAAGLELQSPLVAGELVVDLDAYTVTVGDRPLSLTPRQLELLAVFLAAPGRVWSREQLHALCWGEESSSRRVDVQLCRIRARTGMDVFRNVRDRGWALRAS